MRLGRSFHETPAPNASKKRIGANIWIRTDALANRASQIITSRRKQSW
jgi:hypothetical protein